MLGRRTSGGRNAEVEGKHWTGGREPGAAVQHRNQRTKNFKLETSQSQMLQRREERESRPKATAVQIRKFCSI